MTGVRVFGGSAWQGNAEEKARGGKRVLKKFPDRPKISRGRIGVGAQTCLNKHAGRSIGSNVLGRAMGERGKLTPGNASLIAICCQHEQRAPCRAGDRQFRLSERTAEKSAQ